MNLLVNGCSHTAGDYQEDKKIDRLKRSWASKLGHLLNCTDTVNLSLGGSSNKRILRTTMEHLSKHPDFNGTLIIAWTTHTRNEFTWFSDLFGKKPKGLLGGDNGGSSKKYGHWVLAANPHNGESQEQKLKDFMSLYYNCSHCYEFEKEIFQQQLVMFESYLKQKNINYYFFCALDSIDYKSIYVTQLDKQKWIQFDGADNSCDFLSHNGFRQGYCKHFDHDAQLFLAETIFKQIT